MTGPLHDTAPTGPRRSDYGAVRLGRRDIDGLIMCAEHYGAPYDLLASALAARRSPSLSGHHAVTGRIVLRAALRGKTEAVTILAGLKSGATWPPAAKQRTEGSEGTSCRAST